MQGKQKAPAINSGTPRHPIPPQPPQNAGRLVDGILGFTAPVCFDYLWEEAVVSPTRLTVPAFGPESGTHQFKCLRGGGNGPTFRCTHPLTDKEAAPPLPVSAEASDCFKC